MGMRVGDSFAPTSFTNRASDADFEELLDGFNSVQDAYFDAARRGDLTKIEQFLKNSPTSGLNINAVDRNGNNALQIVAGSDIRSYDAVRVIRNLIRAGVDLLHTNKAGDTASDIAHRSISQGHMFGREKADAVNDGDGVQFLRSIFQGTEERSIAFLEKQKSAASKKYLLDLEVADDVTVLMYAAGNDNADTVQAMVDALKDNPDKLDYLNKVGLGGHTALHAALKDSRSYDILKKAGAKDDIENDDGATPHELRERAIEKRGWRDFWSDPSWDNEQGFFWNLANEMAIGFSNLLSGFKPGHGSHDYAPPATYSPAADDTSATRPPTADESLAEAIFDRDETRAVSLLAKGANAAAGFSRNISFLLYAAASGQNKLVKALLASLEKAGELDDVLNATGINGMTPLLAAAFDGNSKLVDILLAKGADPTAKDELLGITARNALIAARSEDDTTPLHDILKKRASASDAGYRPGRHRFRNWLRRLLTRSRNDEPTTTEHHPPVYSPPESGVEEDATSENGDTEDAASENEDTQGEDIADTLEEADQAGEQSGSGTAPIMGSPVEIILWFTNIITNQPDRFQAWSDIYAFARTNSSIYNILNRLPEYERLRNSVNYAQVLWHSTVQGEEITSLNFHDTVSLSRVWNYLSQNQRNTLRSYILRDGTPHYSAAAIIFPHLTEVEQNFIINSAEGNVFASQNLLYFGANNFEERHSDHRNPTNLHNPRSHFSRLFDTILPSIGRSARSLDVLLPHINQMDANQQMRLLDQAISALSGAAPLDFVDFEASPAIALRDLILNGTEAVRDEAINSLVTALHHEPSPGTPNPRRDEIALALSAGFSDLSDDDQATVTSIIAENNELIPHLWASFGIPSDRTEDETNQDGSAETNFIDLIIRRATSLNEDILPIIFSNVGLALPGLSESMRSRIISNFIPMYSNALDRAHNLRNSELHPPILTPENTYIPAVSSILSNIDTLNPRERAVFIESIIRMTTSENFGLGVLQSIVLRSRDYLHLLSDEEISTLQNAIARMKNGYNKNGALAILTTARDKLNHPETE